MAGRIKFRFTQWQPTRLTTATDLLKYIQENIRRLASSLEILETPIVPTHNVPPSNPEIGQLAIADGTNWNPGSGAGTYIFRANAWHKID